MSAGRSLTARLRRHVPGQLDGPELRWWVPPRAARPLAAPAGGAHPWWVLRARRRDAELAEIVEHLAVLASTGWDLSAALERVARQAGGSAADDLAVVVAWVRDGLPVPLALRRWAEASASDAVGRLAALAGAPHPELAAGLDDLARALDERVHDARLAALHLAAHAAWAISLLLLVVAVA